MQLPKLVVDESKFEILQFIDWQYPVWGYFTANVTNTLFNFLQNSGVLTQDFNCTVRCRSFKRWHDNDSLPFQFPELHERRKQGQIREIVYIWFLTRGADFQCHKWFSKTGYCLKKNSELTNPRDFSENPCVREICFKCGSSFFCLNWSNSFFGSFFKYQSSPPGLNVKWSSLTGIQNNISNLHYLRHNQIGEFHQKIAKFWKPAILAKVTISYFWRFIFWSKNWLKS